MKGIKPQGKQEYKIVTGDIVSVTREVNESLAAGWKLYGTTQMTAFIAHTSTFSQAMSKVFKQNIGGRVDG